MCKIQFFSFLIFSVILFKATCSYKILGIVSMPSHSHHTIGSTVLEALAKKGHEVTFITPFPQKTPTKNIREIPIVEVIKINEEQKKNLFNFSVISAFTNTSKIFKPANDMVECIFKNPEVQHLLHSNEKFDAVYMEYFMNDALMGIAHHFNAPLILVSPMPASYIINHLVGNPGNSATIPNMLTKFTEEMTFIQRVLNTICDVLGATFMGTFFIPGQERILKEYLPHVPELDEVRHSASILLVNSHESINPAVAHVPNMIPIGGFYIAPTKELPEDLKTYLDNAKDGAILFSMGSNLRSADLTIEKRQGILKAFAKIKQKVIWKFEEELEGLPPNVKIYKWLPQQDILAHPNVVAFITHGGLLSTIETVHFGKPIIGIPVFGDQAMNIEQAVNGGYAVNLPLDELGEETLSKALQEILNNPKYRNEAQRRSAIMNDRPVKPLDLAVYWVEYAIRHKGAPHLRSITLKLKWYQNNLLDVYLFLGAIVFISFYILKILITKCCCRRKHKTASDIKKRN